MAYFINLVKDNVLIPVLGKSWLEITVWILLGIFSLLTFIIICLAIKKYTYKKSNNENKALSMKLSSQNNKLKQEKTDLEKSIKYVNEVIIKEKEANRKLNKTLNVLEDTKADLLKKLNAKDAELLSATEKITNLNDNNAKLSEEIELCNSKSKEDENIITELKARIKRLEAARKATRTIAAKKKKQLEEEVNIPENNEEVVD